MTLTADLGAAVARRLEAMTAADVAARIWRRDHTVWKPDPAEIADRLGWLTVAGDMRPRLDELRSFAREAAADGLTTALLLGMGGSSLGPEVLRAALGLGPGALDLTVLDTTHPATIARVESSIDLDRTLVLVASKSGTTVETLSHLAHFSGRVGDGRRFAAITDPGTRLATVGRGFRGVFENPPDIGGRYSALSLFGLVPAALIGADLDLLLAGAEEMAAACGPSVAPADNPALWLGAVIGEAALAGRDKLTLVLPPQAASLGDWVEQLVAESTGKQGTGVVPVVGEELGPPDVYGADRLFLALGEHPGLEAIEAAGHPVVVLPDHRGPGALGAEFFRWELAIAVAGHVLGINPFDQPNVEETKAAARQILEEGPAGGLETGDLGALLATVGPGDYVAIMAYLDRMPGTDALLERARHAIRERHRVATTVGYGPRFLHSTGQLHKGGPPSGAFVQVVDEGRAADLPIPGAAYAFGTLIDAQALGDLRALRARGRRVVRVHAKQLEEVTA